MAGTYDIVNYLRGGPFKAKNFLPAAGTYDIVNYFKRGPFQSQKFSACGRHYINCELEEMCLFVATPLWGRGGGNPPSHLEI